MEDLERMEPETVDWRTRPSMRITVRRSKRSRKSRTTWWNTNITRRSRHPTCPRRRRPQHRQQHRRRRRHPCPTTRHRTPTTLARQELRRRRRRRRITKCAVTSHCRIRCAKRTARSSTSARSARKRSVSCPIWRCICACTPASDRSSATRVRRASRN